MLDKLKVRHFILCDNLIDFQESATTFTAESVREFIIANSYPTKVSILGVLGIYFLQPGKEYLTEMRAYQDDPEKLLGVWVFELSTVDKPNDIMNYGFMAHEFYILNPGLIRFDIIVNGALIDQQYILAREEMPEE